MNAMVYSSLELSYRHLHGDEAKSLFLLCGLMDNDIFIDDLLKYVMALRLFQGTNTLEETRNKVETLVDNLKASNLLLETSDNAFVRMHDVVRDVALAIASKDHVFSLREGVGLEEWPKLDELQSCNKISLAYNDIRKLPEGLSWCENYETTESLKLNKLNTSLHSMDGISKLLKRAKDLYLRELSGANHVLSEVDKEGFPALKHFHLKEVQKFNISCIQWNKFQEILSSCLGVIVSHEAD
ncbi:putative disease resistance protein [Vitis vinifera]|uniref:Putative disease resistance protein n=1 Tax=Vitis vinifera TaxID=29760 RepID=A0A438GEM5_VITVI|nr:putative disease resistance protein [Vitis vinifera]